MTVGTLGKFDLLFCVGFFFFFLENLWVGLLCWACRGVGFVSIFFFFFFFFFFVLFFFLLES